MTLHQPRPPVTLAATRARVLDIIRAARHPLSLDDIAAAAGIHRNTARFHVAALTDAGLAQMRSESAEGPGRPRLLCEATPLATSYGRRDYATLAMRLAHLLSAQRQSSRAALEAGREWGRSMAAAHEGSTWPDARIALQDTMASLGFEPQSDAPAGTLTLFNCPFLEVAREHDVVCTLHLGLMQGLVRSMGGGVEVASLEPNTATGPCVATMTNP